ncbi:RidA family protein [Variovorax sp. CCNWLW225]|jgi:enamine deaminase RidA (YjgF/YER057c/UK114 family)|uniref:RidA family protein n=1 Tax=Variovorax sp. CCNWLW225 TaxID=3127462 RepID=UPI003076A94F
MNTTSKERAQGPGTGAEQRLKDLGIRLPEPPEPFGIYAMSVQSGSQLFLTGMLPTRGHTPQSVGRLGAELDADAARESARVAVLNALALVRKQLGSLDRVVRIVRLGVFVATVGDVREHPKVADGASVLLQDVFGKASNPSRVVVGVASLPLGVPVELDLIFEVTNSGGPDGPTEG